MIEVDKPSTNGITRSLNAKGGDLKSFFGGKENRDPTASSFKIATTSKTGKAVKVEKVKKQKTAPPKKKRKTDDDEDSDFVIDGAKDDVEEDDDSGSFAVESEAEDDQEEDVESNHSAGTSVILTNGDLR